MSQHKKVLLYSGTIPGEQGVGGIILDDLCESLGEKNIQCFAAVPRGSNLSKLKENPYLLGGVERRYETSFQPFSGMAGALISSLAYRTKFLSHANHIAKVAVESGKSFGADRLWAVLDCPTIIATAKQVAQKLQLPLHVLVWDAPELIARQLGHGSQTTKLIMKSFQECLQQAKRVAVVGESMQKAYRQQYQVESVIVRHGLPFNENQNRQFDVSNSEQILIGYAGSITASDTFDNLIESLALCDWKINGKQVTLRLIGARYQLEPRGPQQIEYFGWQPVQKTIQLLQKCDILYLPQPFDETNRDLAELSFPTKLTTYLAAQRPVLLHAPNYASVVSFYDKYPFGIWSDTLNSKQLIAAIETFLNDPTSITNAINEGRKAVQEELNADVFIERFNIFINNKSERDKKNYLKNTNDKR